MVAPEAFVTPPPLMLPPRNLQRDFGRNPQCRRVGDVSGDGRVVDKDEIRGGKRYAGGKRAGQRGSGLRAAQPTSHDHRSYGRTAQQPPPGEGTLFSFCTVNGLRSTRFHLRLRILVCPVRIPHLTLKSMPDWPSGRSIVLFSARYEPSQILDLVWSPLFPG